VLEGRALPPEALLGAGVAIDYALRPVLTSMGAAHIVQGWFSLDQDIAAEGGMSPVAPAAAVALERVTDQFSAGLGGRTDRLTAAG
jgi:FMN reductase